MTRNLGIAAVQMSPVPWDKAATVGKMLGLIEQVARTFPWVDLILFPELCATGMASFTPGGVDWRSLAEPLPGPTSERLAQAARRHGKWVMAGSVFERDGECIYNTALVFSPEGELAARYRKLFPWRPFEATEAGDAFCVFDIPGVGRLGLCICYDMWFPEVVRTLAWMGAEVILHPTLTTTSDRPQELVLSRANAIFNQCYFLDVNSAGPWAMGHSLLVDPDGRVLQQAATDECVLTEIIDLDLVTRTREYGTLGLNQVWKQLRDSPHGFPTGSRLAQGEIFRGLGPLRMHRSVAPAPGGDGRPEA